MSCNCNKKSRPRYRLFGKWIVKQFRGKESLPEFLDDAVQEITNNCCCDHEFCGKYYGQSEDGTRKFRLVFPDAGTTLTIQEVDPTTLEDI